MSDKPEPLYKKAFFWIAIAFFIYSAGNFFLFLFKNSSKQDENFQIQYTIIYSTFTILKNVLLCIGLYLNKNNEGTSNSINPKNEDPWEIPAQYKKINP